jgi:acetolactate synthase-1/3 small subunit
MTVIDTRAASRMRIVTAVVEDHPGVLTRVTGMIRRRGFNIGGLSVGRVEASGRSRLTLAVDAGHAEVDQVRKQLDRLVEVIAVADLTGCPRLVHELAMVRLAAAGRDREPALDQVRRHGARVLESSPGELVAELSAEPAGVEAFVEAVGPYGILELARSGPVAMARAAVPAAVGPSALRWSPPD